MKLHTKIITCLTVVVFILCSLTSCIDGNVAKQTIADFLSAIAAGDYDTATSHLHPDRPADLQPYLENIEQSESVDFQAGIEILGYSSVKSAHYDSTVDGSTYMTTCRTKIGDQTVSITVEIVDNDAGYGIYNFTIDF